MNFSYHNLRKPLSLLLATALTATLFTGCSMFKKDTSDTDDTTPQNPGISLSDTSAPAETETPTTEATEPINENTATVTSQLNIRSSPSTEATVVGTLDAGDKVEISRREEVTGISWAYIISPEAGWIVMDYVEMDIPSQMPTGGDTSTPAGEGTATEPSSGDTDTVSIKGVVTVNNLNIRSEGSSDGKVQGSYNKGDVITILETKNGWGRTNKGWVKLEYVNTSGTTTDTSTDTTNNSTSNNTTVSTGNGSTTVQFRGIVTASQLNIRASASKDSESVGSYSYGARVEILEKSGDWGRTSKGWISLNYVYQDGTTGTNTAKGTITAGGGLNIRSGPGKAYTSVGTYAEGDSVTILEQFTYDGVTWGCTSKGWISMAYVDTGSGSSSSSTSSSDSQQAIVTTESGLRVRSGAGTSYDVVGSLKYGTKVTILSQKTVDGTTWGEISTGWICMDYVTLD
ncbi:MAG: SH3 domain-containing protein [Eubacteriales bacterium]|nr:SH3 domain-containing protein [Eubacteriales bacterium]